MQPPAVLTDLAILIPSAELDIRYATENNFTGIKLYKQPIAWLRQEPAEQFKKAADKFHNMGFRVVIFDAYRPVSVQAILRRYCDDDDYVETVSNHSRGITVDITLAYSGGSYLDMGTDYDDFTERAWPGSSEVTDEQLANRKMLAEIMSEFGFTQYPHEWWHFDYRPGKKWDVIEDEQNSYR